MSDLGESNDLQPIVDNSSDKSNQDDLKNIHRILECFWNNVDVMSSHIKYLKKRKRKITCLESATKALGEIRNIYATIEKQNKFIYDSTVKKLKLFNIEADPTEKTVHGNLRHFSLSLKKSKTPSFTDDDVSCFSFLLGLNHVSAKNKDDENDNMSSCNTNDNNCDTISPLHVRLHDYDLIFDKSAEQFNYGIKVLNNNEEEILEKNYIIKSNNNVNLITNELSENVKLKIDYCNVSCLIRKSGNQELNVTENSITRTETCNNKLQSELESDALKKEPIDNDSLTHCSELSIENFEDFDVHTEKLNDSDTPAYTIPLSNDMELEMNALEDLLSEKTTNGTDVSDVDDYFDDVYGVVTDDEYRELNVHNGERDMISKQLEEVKGRVIVTNLPDMKRHLEEFRQASHCCVKIVRDKSLETILKKHMDRHKDTTEAEIRRLTNLKSLERRRSVSNFFVRNKRKRKRCRYVLSSTESDDSSTKKSTDDGESSTDDQQEFDANPSMEVGSLNQCTDDHNDKDRQLELLQEAHSDSEETSSKDSTSTDEEIVPKVKRKRIQSNASDSEKERSKPSRKSKWRNDRLLNEKFNLSSSENNSTSNSCDSDESSSSDGSEEAGIIKKRLFKKLMKKQENKKRRATEKESAALCADTEAGTSKEHSTEAAADYSSDVLLLSSGDEGGNNGSDSTKLNRSDDDVVLLDSEPENVTKKGRRNIRALLSDNVLRVETKKANKEEELRKQRLLEKEKQLEKFSTQTQQQHGVEEEKPDEESEFVLDVDDNLQPLIKVDQSLTNRLKPHQKEGVKFMWNACYESVKRIESGEENYGCIIAHCMGLGKTFQVVTLIHTLFTHSVTQTKYVLVICPLSTVLNWKNEFTIGLRDVQRNDINVFTISDQTREKKDRLCLVDDWWHRTGVLIMGYQTYVSLVQSDKNVNRAKLVEALIDPGPDLIVCDEGHLLKNNKTLSFQKLSDIRTKRRIVLTGTPMQNNLKEYYYMVQFVKPNLLGSYNEFTNRFINPITNGQFHDSRPSDTQLMKKRSHVLHKLLKNTIQRYEVSELQTYLPPKMDFVVFVRLSDVQVKLYQMYISLIIQQEPFRRDTILKHYHNLQLVWNHPLLLVLKQAINCKKKPREVDVYGIDTDMTDENYVGLPNDWWKGIVPNDSYDELQLGSKFMVAQSIIRISENMGDKVLIFSSSLIELDALEKFLTTHGTRNRPWKKNIDYYRLDGTVTPDVRMTICDNFNDESSTAKALIISQRVGGLGLNLVAANRVILLDVSWNPAYDSQSIFRVYRFGQKKQCFIYRLVCKGTLEETIYVRSVNKLATAGRVVDERQLPRHFKEQDLQFLYKFDDDLNALRPMLKVPHDQLLAVLLGRHKKEIFSYHEHQSLLENLPHEELNEEEMKLAWEEFNKEKEQHETIVANQPATNAIVQQRIVNTDAILQELLLQPNRIDHYQIDQSHRPADPVRSQVPFTRTDANSDVIVIED